MLQLDQSIDPLGDSQDTCLSRTTLTAKDDVVYGGLLVVAAVGRRRLDVEDEAAGVAELMIVLAVAVGGDGQLAAGRCGALGAAA